MVLGSRSRPQRIAELKCCTRLFLCCIRLAHHIAKLLIDGPGPLETGDRPVVSRLKTWSLGPVTWQTRAAFAEFVLQQLLGGHMGSRRKEAKFGGGEAKNWYVTGRQPSF